MSVFDTLASMMGGDTVSQISRQIGADQGATSTALAAALPMLVSALARNSATESGASALSSALARDHDGSLLDNLGGFLGNASAGPGGGILKHVLGNRRGAVESALSQQSGLNSAGAGQLLEILAPIVMGALGKNARQQGLDSTGLAGLLGQESARFNQAAPGSVGLLGLLDANSDGSVVDDISRLAGGLLGWKPEVKS